MISNPSRLSNDQDVLVIDTSVAINLLGTGKPAEIFRLLNRKVLIDERALEEVTIDPFNKLHGRESMEALMNLGVISPIQLSAPAFEMFLDLTGANPPDDLGDGEAATIAQAFDIGAVPVIDERKATRISLSLRPKHPVLHTIDILACSAVADGFSRQEIGDLIYAARRHVRMRVPVSCRDWVCDAIGTERVKDCPSLGSVKGFGLR